MKYSLRIAVGLVSVFALLGGSVACTKQSAPAITAVLPTLVRAEEVAYSTEAVPVYATGVLRRKTEAGLPFKVGGLVDEVAVRPGDTVKKGQVLARLRLDEINAHVAQARSGLEKTQRDLIRAEKLRADNVATLENLQDAKTAVTQAEASVRIAEFNLEHAVIVAPADGRILRRLAEPGEMAEAGRAVLVFASDEDGWIVRAGIAERDVVRLQLGNGVEVKADGGTASSVGGRVTQISEAADPATRTTEVEFLLDSAPSGGRSGFVVRAVVTPKPVEARPVVAASALVEGVGNKAFLFLVDAKAVTARRVLVEVAGLDDGRVYLTTLLPRGAKVVTSGVEYLQDGAAVTVANN